MLFTALEIFEDSAARSAAMNMALDEALLARAAVPALRFYQWSAPAVSFGYFGRVADATEFSAGRDLVRRWTGGGIVPHGSDTTYAIIVPATSEAFAKSSIALYCEVHAALAAALAQQGFDASLASIAPPKISDACFANPVAADVVIGATKVAGAAHRRTKLGLLHQGSVQIDGLGGAFAESFARGLSSSCLTRTIDADIEREAAQITQRKYATNEWNRRR